MDLKIKLSFLVAFKSKCGLSNLLPPTAGQFSFRGYLFETRDMAKSAKRGSYCALIDNTTKKNGNDYLEETR